MPYGNPIIIPINIAKHSNHGDNLQSAAKMRQVKGGPKTQLLTIDAHPRNFTYNILSITHLPRYPSCSQQRIITITSSRSRSSRCRGRFSLLVFMQAHYSILSVLNSVNPGGGRHTGSPAGRHEEKWRTANKAPYSYRIDPLLQICTTLLHTD